MIRFSRFGAPLLSVFVLASGAWAKVDYRVTCKDGAISKPGRGACSKHGGIAADKPSGQLCLDGTISKDTGRDACKGHDGVAKTRDRVVPKDADKLDTKKSKDYRYSDDSKPSDDRDARKTRDNARDDRKADNRDIPDKDRRANRDTKGSVTCKDGVVKSGRLGCFGHGGVATSTYGSPDTGALSPAPQARTSPRSTPRAVGREDTDPTGAIARCKDGLFSHSAHHSGACSRHGGVAEWLDGSEKR